MSIFTSRSSAAQGAVNTRRSFLQKLGFGVSALGSSAVLVNPAACDDAASMRIARLEAEKALRALHQRYETAMDDKEIDKALALFTGDAEVVFNGGVFRGRDTGINRLFRQHFLPGHSGKRMEPAPGFALSAEQLEPKIDIAPNLRSASAVLPYSIQVGRPIESASSLADMARLHGGGVRTWWEGGHYEVTYLRDTAADTWLINRLIYNTLSRADYRAGRSHASAITVAPFTLCFPQHAVGPDRLV